MKYINLFIAGVMMVFTNGCSYSAQPLDQQLTAQQMRALTKVYQFDIKASQITFVVSSNGCTRPQDFELKQQPGQGATLELALIRLKVDRCRAMPRPFPLTFKLDEPVAQKSDLVLLNPRGDLDALPGKRKVKG